MAFEQFFYLLVMVFRLVEFGFFFFKQENDILKGKSEAVDHSSQHEEDKEEVSAHATSLQLGRKDESKTTDVPAWEGGTITESRNEVSVAEASRLVVCLS